MEEVGGGAKRQVGVSAAVPLLSVVEGFRGICGSIEPARLVFLLTFNNNSRSCARQADYCTSRYGMQSICAVLGDSMSSHQ